MISDGTETNLSNYTYIYASSIINNWYLNYINKNNIKHNKINLVPTVWFNEKLDSHYFILPGSLAITMTLIGMLLTALVVSREWEKGTYESLITTHMTKLQFILSKYIPYFILGMLSMSFNIFLCIFLFKLPLRGNFFIILLVSAMFLYACLGFGLIISTYYKNQFLASQTVLIVGFMPSLMLSGLIYPISSMPIVLQYVTKIIPAKYFVSFIQSEFMVGSVFSIILPNLLFLFSLGTIFFSIVFHLTKMRLE